MGILGIILIIAGGIMFLFWTSLLKEREYINDPTVFWLATLITAVLLFGGFACLN